MLGKADWKIYYADGSVVSGFTQHEWPAAPDVGVQVVVLMEPGSSGWTYSQRGLNIVVTDRQLWTGQDEYDPFGWGVKYGAWLTDMDYFNLWNRACSD